MLDLAMTLADLPIILGIGLLAGMLGGMLGVGGSVIMIPALTILLGPDQHLYQAAAMIANVAVAIPATIRHRQAGAIHGRTLRWMLPTAVVFILVGVWLSNIAAFQGSSGELGLRRVFAAFLVYVIVLNVFRLRSDHHDEHMTAEHVTGPRAAGVGAIMGTVAGLLGIGGGAIAVPLQQVVLRLPLKRCIANSSAVICISAGIGAIYKNASLPAEGAWVVSLQLAASLAPAAWIGGRLGASLTHRLPVRQVRIGFIALMILAAYKMAQLPWP